MPNRWPGGIIRKTPVTPNGPSENGSAPGVWTIMEAAYWSKRGLWPTAGVVSDPYWSSVSYLMSTTATNGGQNNTFVDSSTNNFTITRFGNATQGSVSPFQSPPPVYPGYNSSTYAGSVYFDGSGDYISAPNNAAFNLSNGDFTLECWVYNSEVGNFCGLAGVWGGGYILYREATSYKFYYAGPAGSPLVSSIAAVANVWTHLAVVRSGTTLRLYVNGVQAASASVSTTAISFPTYPFVAGANYDSGVVGYPFTGFMASLRLVKGTAVYTSAFTPPTGPLTAISGTSILCNFSNGNIFDASMRCNLETAGNAQVSTTQAKFGTTSVAFDGSGDYLRAYSDNANIFAFGTGDFTIETWAYFNSVSGQPFIYDGRGVATTPTIYIFNGTLYYFSNSANRITGSTLSTGQWYHIAVCRSGTSTRMFVNGTQVGSTYTDNTNYTNAAGRPVIGAEAGLASGYLSGYLDDMRVTKGVARYTANFTAPTAPFPLF